MWLPLNTIGFFPPQAIYSIKEAYKSEEERAVPGLTPEEVVERIFHLVDENGDGNNLIWSHTDVLFEIMVGNVMPF